MNLLTHRRGSVALMTGIMAPVMVMTLAMGIEVTSWSVTNVELQRTADVSAWAGARQYVVAANAQGATGTAANLAEINGASGTATRTWNAATLTTTDNLITAQVVPGVRNAADTAIKVTVQRNIAKSFSLIFPSSQSSVTISATAIAEIVSAQAGPQPCLLALNAGGSGVTDLTLTGSANVTSTNCSIVSNAGITLTGTSSLNVDGTYAGGAITPPRGETLGEAVTGGAYQNSGQVADPYASDAQLQTAFSSLSPGVGLTGTFAGSTTATLSPGTYSSLNLSHSANVTLKPGTYIINGNVAFQGNSIITGSNVTIIFSGTLTDANSASVSLTAPTSASGVGIPGILFAGDSTSASSFSGSVTLPVTGVIYYPNGNLSFGGSADSTGANCSEVIAGTITLTGASSVSASGCTTYGTVPFGSLPASSSIVLVQ
jgi:Flp pilus assembly protein TadG